MGLAKSSLSRHIIQLEKHLNVQLLHRNTRCFSLTTLGEQIYRHALQMLSAAEAVETSVQQARGAPNGLLRLAAPSRAAGCCRCWRASSTLTRQCISPCSTMMRLWNWPPSASTWH